VEVWVQQFKIKVSAKIGCEFRDSKVWKTKGIWKTKGTYQPPEVVLMLIAAFRTAWIRKILQMR